MARTRSPDKREAFLQAALALFAADGVSQTSTAAIAAKAGTASGTLFIYFPTKQDLIDELVLRISREQSEYIKGLLHPSLSARDAFFTIWEGSIRWFRDNPEAYQYVQQVRDSGLIGEEAVQASQTFLNYYFVAMEKGWDEGSIKPYPPELVGGVLYQNVVAVMNLLRSQPEADKAEMYIQAGFAIFWDGIKERSE
jgi:AcrR family transcriptional regulator